MHGMVRATFAPLPDASQLRGLAPAVQTAAARVPRPRCGARLVVVVGAVALGVLVVVRVQRLGHEHLAPAQRAAAAARRGLQQLQVALALHCARARAGLKDRLGVRRERAELDAHILSGAAAVRREPSSPAGRMRAAPQ